MRPWRPVRFGPGLQAELYAVCPFSLDKGSADELRLRSKEFRAVPHERLVTIKWLEACQRAGKQAALSPGCQERSQAICFGPHLAASSP